MITTTHIFRTWVKAREADGLDSRTARTEFFLWLNRIRSESWDAGNNTETGARNPYVRKLVAIEFAELGDVISIPEGWTAPDDAAEFVKHLVQCDELIYVETSYGYRWVPTASTSRNRFYFAISGVTHCSTVDLIQAGIEVAPLVENDNEH